MIDVRRPPRFLGVSLAGVAMTALSVLALADEPKTRPASKDAQRASGVIVKVERDDKKPGKCIVTINTAAVWRDWARDQRNEPPGQSARKDAREGRESIATKGEPGDHDTLVKVEIADDSRIETRFRAVDDETGKGSKNPPGETRREPGKPTRFHAKDLKAGLFIESDFRRKDERNVASTVAVIRPVAATATK